MLAQLLFLLVCACTVFAVAQRVHCSLFACWFLQAPGLVTRLAFLAACTTSFARFGLFFPQQFIPTPLALLVSLLPDDKQTPFSHFDRNGQETYISQSSRDQYGAEGYLMGIAQVSCESSCASC